MTEHSEINKIRLDRMRFFTDAVLAIILTLLVLDLHLPNLADATSAKQMFDQFAHLLPHFYAFFLCFLAIAQSWLAMNAFFSLVVKYNNTMGFFMILTILPLCLLPFSASLIGEYFYNPFSFVFFGTLYLFASIVTLFFTRYMWNNKMLSPAIDAKYFEKHILKGNWISPIVFLIIIGTAFISTVLSFILFVTLLFFWIFMIRQLKLTKEEK